MKAIPLKRKRKGIYNRYYKGQIDEKGLLEQLKHLYQGAAKE